MLDIDIYIYVYDGFIEIFNLLAMMGVIEGISRFTVACEVFTVEMLDFLVVAMFAVLDLLACLLADVLRI